MTVENRFEELYDHVLGKLFTQLSSELSYHNERHTLDVLNVCEQKIREEDLDDRSADQLRVAALLHDIGFIRSMDDHEFFGCRIAEEILPDFGYNESFIRVVQDLIMSTKVPQAPDTFLEKLLCDADLDYLGRDDFQTISGFLFDEMKFRKVVTNIAEWDAIQIKFLKQHRYWTDRAIQSRVAKKQAHLNDLIQQYS